MDAAAEAAIGRCNNPLSANTLRKTDNPLRDAIAPGSTTRIGNTFYKTQEEFLFASADAMREEYKAILDAGLILQLDDPALATDWDMINPEPTVEDYKKFDQPDGNPVC